MILFPNCKINLGLDVTAKRPDGYHDIATVMYPLHGLCDSLEIIPSADPTASLTMSGIDVACAPADNIVTKAWRIMHEEFGTGGATMHLHKGVPSGAGLGGGSSDGAFALMALNALYGINLDNDGLESMALRLGSDVPFFIHNTPQRCSGRGEIMTPCSIDLTGYWIVLVKPPVFVSTAEAYAGIKPHTPTVPLAERISRPIEEWKDVVTNAFEDTVFARHPRLASIKQALYDAGALYASMSGSGSTIYGLFAEQPSYTAAEGDWMWSARL